MAVVMIEGCDHFTAAEATAKNWNRAFTNMQPGRFDGQAGRTTGSSTQFTKTLPAAYSTLILGFAFRTSQASASWGANNALIIQTPAVATVMTLGADGSGHLVVKNSGGTTIATGTTVIAPNTWYYIEIKLFVNGASGTVELHLNGVSGEIASTTGNFGSTSPDRFSVLGLNANTDYDDMYVVDTTGASPRNTFLGDVRVETIYPTSDGAHSQWTPNTGSTHYTQVSEAQADGDTTYVGDSTPNDIDTYGCGDIDTGATVYGVQTNLYARKDDASARQIAPVIRQSGSDNVGATVTLSASYLFYSQLYNQDPASADWTPTTVNADEFGVKEIA